MANARRCPACGVPVTPFAAGCAVCGADLEAHRRHQSERRARFAAVRPPGLPRPRVSSDVVIVSLSAAGALLFPFLALLLIFFWVRDPMHANLRAPLVACAVLAAVMLALPSLRYGVLGFL